MRFANAAPKLGVRWVGNWQPGARVRRKYRAGAGRAARCASANAGFAATSHALAGYLGRCFGGSRARPAPWAAGWPSSCCWFQSVASGHCCVAPAIVFWPWAKVAQRAAIPKCGCCWRWGEGGRCLASKPANARRRGAAWGWCLGLKLGRYGCSSWHITNALRHFLPQSRTCLFCVFSPCLLWADLRKETPHGQRPDQSHYRCLI